MLRAAYRMARPVYIRTLGGLSGGGQREYAVSKHDVRGPWERFRLREIRGTGRVEVEMPRGKVPGRRPRAGRR
jgi:hypothetical protein